VPRLRACIFDLDGTVVDSHAYTFAAFRAACAGVARPPTDAEIFAAFGPPERVILERLLPPAALEPAYARLQAYYATHAAGLEMHPEMRPLLGDCRAAGVRLGLFTGRGTDSTSLVLHQLDLEWAFDAVVAGAMALRPKPAPDGVVQLLERLGVAAGDALVVGDSPLDLQAAGRAGCRGGVRDLACVVGCGAAAGCGARDAARCAARAARARGASQRGRTRKFWVT
jgi:HAD superfamily hydrolase (TIGR01509 family)